MNESMAFAGKVAVVIAIWIAVAIIGFGMAIYGSETGRSLLVYYLLPLLIALAGTVLVWILPVNLGTQTEKTKRQAGDRLELLLDLLDEDERAALRDTLRQRLADEVADGSDGELPYDADTLEAMQTVIRPAENRGESS